MRTRSLLSCLLSLTLLLSCTPKPDSKNHKVGAILPLSGEFAFIGENMRKGMELALKDYKDSGIEVIYEDDQSLSSTAALSGLRKLIHTDETPLVFNPYVNTIKALASTVNDEGVPTVVLWDSTDEIAKLGEHVYSMGYPTELAGEDMATFAYHDLGVRNLSIVSAQDEWSEIISGAFVKTFSRLGGTIDLHKKVDVEESDFRTVLSEIKQMESEALYFPIFYTALHNLVRQSKEMGFDGYMLSADGFFHSDIAEIGDAAEGVFLTQLYFGDGEFWLKYEEMYGSEEPSNLAFAAMGFDAITLYKELIDTLTSQGKAVNSETLHALLPGFQFQGLIEPVHITKDRVTTKRQRILEVKNGHFKLVETL